MTIRFFDYRMHGDTAEERIKNYGKEIYTTTDCEDARRFMRENEKTMRFLVGGGRMINNDPCNMAEIYWEVVTK